MIFSDITTRIKLLPIKEVRFDLKKYLEVVTAAENEATLQFILEEFFGPPRKVAGAPMQDPESEEFMWKFGGLRINQALYFKKTGEFIYYAMLWPWGDRTNLTLKVEECPL